MRNRYEIKLSEVERYNKEIHDNHKKQWTSKEVEYILNTKRPLAELSVELGRTANAIRQKRKEIKLLKEREKFKKIEIMP